MKYRLAPEVAALAADIIAEHHPDLDTDEVRIEYLFVAPPPTSNGRTVWGRARRVGGLAAVLADLAAHDSEFVEDPRPMFVVEISEPIWSELDDNRRRALIDHELMHLVAESTADGKTVLSTRGHDFEEFTAILRRRGLWTAAAVLAARELGEQLALQLDQELDGIRR